MSDTNRKHITVRYIPAFELAYSDDEKAYGAVLPFLPDSASVIVHDVHQIGHQYFASVSLLTEEVVSEEELAAALEEESQAAADAAPESTASVIELPKKPRRKRSGPPPTGGA